ncbi:unnamed protein product, partial [marine sediment metagenome]
LGKYAPDDPEMAEIYEDQAFFALTGIPPGQLLYRLQLSASVATRYSTTDLSKMVGDKIAKYIVDAKAPHAGLSEGLVKRKLRNEVASAVSKRVNQQLRLVAAPPHALARGERITNEMLQNAIKKGAVEAGDDIGPYFVNTYLRSGATTQTSLNDSIDAARKGETSALLNADEISDYLSSEVEMTVPGADQPIPPDELTRTIEGLRGTMSREHANRLSKEMTDQLMEGKGEFQ